MNKSQTPPLMKTEWAMYNQVCQMRISSLYKVNCAYMTSLLPSVVCGFELDELCKGDLNLSLPLSWSL